MAEATVGDPSARKFHPFFTKGPANLSTAPETNANGNHDEDEGELTSESRGDDERRKRRKTDTSLPQDGSEVKKRRRRRRNDTASLNSSILSHLTKAEQTATPVAAPAVPPPQDNALPNASAITTQPAQALPAPETPSQAKKVLKFNPSTGTLGSPPKPKAASTPSRVVVMKYGRDDQHRKDLGQKIAQILDGTLQIETSPTEKRTAGRKPKTTPSQGTKSTHPFFAGKPKSTPASSNKPEAPQKQPARKHSVFMSTPVSPQKPRAVAWSKTPQFGVKSFGMKVAGALHPLWPPKDMCHVRDPIAQPRVRLAGTPTHHSKKSKGQVVTISPAESVLSHVVNGMALDGIRDSIPRDENAFIPPPSQLRLPQRHFESGRKLQNRIRSQLRTYRAGLSNCEPDSDIDELTGFQPETNHAAIERMYTALETQLSAYDRSDCESQAWTHKYAPVTAAQIMQAGKEGLLLKQWLQALKVDSVQTGNSEANVKGKGKSDGAPRKRRKKTKLEGFIVDSDEEANEMDAVSSEDDLVPASSGQSSKSVIRSGDLASRKSKKLRRPHNMILISGPCGSGKTAAVYAVAKELGYDVFEINSSSRRSGKDILDKVGDMTRNHLVQQHQAEQPPNDDAEDQVTKDLKSGKQGTMASFFKAKAQETKTPKKQVKETETEIPKTAAPKGQKQCLILLEEVDVLFEEDKQFWATLMGMVTQSKRPFIMTCNDEKMVPIQSMLLHGIFRFAPPPTDLAVDLCLLIAANEGHALQRSAVAALYDSRGNDLRATITDLNYWCQLGVGDRRGGFDWFYLRWPKGSDLDENGDVVRVISEDTYQRGMGWLGRDQLVSTSDEQEMEEEAMRQSWDSWKLDMGDWRSSLGLDSWAESLPTHAAHSGTNEALEAYDNFSRAMSDADLCASGSYGDRMQQCIDSTMPDLPDKTRNDYIVGQSLLEANLIHRHVSPNIAMATSIKSLAKTDLRHWQDRLGPASTLSPVGEEKAVNILESSFQEVDEQMTRYDIALAFDPIAVSVKATPAASLDPSIFDQTMRLIVLDVAPWVRGIVAYDNRLMAERLKLSNLLSEGGKRKRMRTTRAAYSALEGGERSTTRREKYFGDVLTTGFVMRTGGAKWQEAIQPKEVETSAPSSPKSVDSAE